MVRVLLADDHLVVRAGLKALLEATGRIEVVGEASSGAEAIERARALEPDIVIMDVAMPGMDGIEATRRIAALGLGTRILVLTIHEEDEFLVQALDAGAAGFLNKSAADAELSGAIEAVLRGHSYLPGRAAALLARRKRGGAPARKTGLEALSKQERTVIKLYAEGFSAREMGTRMLLSPKTVEGYLARSKRKLELQKRSDIVHFALGAGLLQDEEDE